MPTFSQTDKPSNNLTEPKIGVERKYIKDAYLAIRMDTESTNGNKVSFTKTNKIKVGDEVYIIAETDNAIDLPIKFNIKQGVEKGIVEVDETITVQQNGKDVGIITATVGAYCEDASVENKDDFQNWAIAKVIMQPLDESKQKVWHDTLEGIPDKKSRFYLLVDAHTNSEKDYLITYHGRNPGDEGKPDYKTTPNRWLDMDGKWLELEFNDCCTRDITKEQLKNIASYATDTNIETHLTGINEAFIDNDINTCLRKIHFLAQLIHESGSFQYTEEIGASETDYGGFKGRGLIQITFESNYEAYGTFVGEDFTSSQSNKEKLENNPHAAKSAGWYWGQKAKLNDEADSNDFIYITYAVNGGYNGYDDRLNWVEKGFDELYEKCTQKNEETSIYSFSNSKAYNIKKASFGWGLWHDPGLTKNGCTKNKDTAIEGYERFISLHDAEGSPALTKKWYGYEGSIIRSTVEDRLANLKNN